MVIIGSNMRSCCNDCTYWIHSENVAVTSCYTSNHVHRQRVTVETGCSHIPIMHSVMLTHCYCAALTVLANSQNLICIIRHCDKSTTPKQWHIERCSAAKTWCIPVQLEQTGSMPSPTSWQSCHKKLWRFLNHPVATKKTTDHICYRQGSKKPSF